VRGERTLPQGDRALRHADRLVGALLQQDIVAVAHLLQMLRMQEQVCEGPCQRRVEVGLCTHVQHITSRAVLISRSPGGRSANGIADALQ